VASERFGWLTDHLSNCSITEIYHQHPYRIALSPHRINAQTPHRLTRNSKPLPTATIVKVGATRNYSPLTLFNSQSLST